MGELEAVVDEIGTAAVGALGWSIYGAGVRSWMAQNPAKVEGIRVRLRRAVAEGRL